MSTAATDLATRIEWILAEWEQGCTCADPGKPEECPECTRGALDSIKASVQRFRNGEPQPVVAGHSLGNRAQSTARVLIPEFEPGLRGAIPHCDTCGGVMYIDGKPVHGDNCPVGIFLDLKDKQAEDAK